MKKMIIIFMSCLLGIFVGLNYVYIYETDCISVNVHKNNDGYLIGYYQDNEVGGRHYAEYYIGTGGEKIVYDQATGNTGKLLSKYLEEQKQMTIGAKSDILSYFYFKYTKTELAFLLKKYLG